MKKSGLLLVIFVVIIVLIIGLMLFLNPEKEKINVYLFWGDGCPHCEHAKEFFNNNSEYNRYYDLVEYEVWYDIDNEKLMEKVKEELNISVTGVPLIVIGSKYFSGYSGSLNEKINETILSMYNSKEYVDIVNGLK